MENNTITPNPAPRPQPTAPMPTFGSTPAPQPAAPAPQPVAAMPLQTPTPAQPAQPTQPTQPAQPAQPTQPIQPLQPMQPAQPVQPMPQPAQQPVNNPAGVTPLEGLNNSAGVTPSEGLPENFRQDNFTGGTSGGRTPATNSEPATGRTPAVNSTPTATPTVTVNPVSKSRLAILISLIAAVIVAAIMLVIVLVLNSTPQENPTTLATAAMSNLIDPNNAPKAISGDLELSTKDDQSISASFLVTDGNLYLTYTGLTTTLNSYLGLDTATAEETASLAALQALLGLVKTAEDEWWQIPLDDLAFASLYRKYPFLSLTKADATGYLVDINASHFMDFLDALEIDFDDTTDAEDGLSLALVPSRGRVHQFVKELPDFKAEINSDRRFTRFTTSQEMDDFSTSVTVNLSYGNSVKTPDEYRPITELMSDFIEAIGY